MSIKTAVIIKQTGSYAFRQDFAQKNTSTLSSHSTVLHSVTMSDFLVPRMRLKLGKSAISTAVAKV